MLLVYALVSMRESPGSLVGMAMYAILIPAWTSAYIAGAFDIDVPIELQLSIGIVFLLVASIVGSHLRNQPGYIEFLAEWAALRRGLLKAPSTKNSIQGLKWHFKSIERIADKKASSHFEAIVKADQLSRGQASKVPLAYHQITYGIELGIVSQSQSLPDTRFLEPIEEYKDAYVKRFHGTTPTGKAWASFLVDYFESMPNEIKTIASSRVRPSIYNRLSPHITFWHLVFTLVGAILLVWVTATS